MLKYEIFVGRYLPCESPYSIRIPENRQRKNSAFGNILSSDATEQPTQPAFTCSKLTIEILEQGVKYVQS